MALSLLLFLAPLIGMVVVGVIAVAVPAILFTGKGREAKYQ